ncbi:hypothetical protein CY0110_16557 [Crocosphaera chwakensis CCY0110]|uniref:Uncharacterized protein n=1 Tax=Crocosphaera chwakensis CCY0110 TaxID=391612 RepID=A3IHZ3_9CHRO|nr:hypothetical protein CY0110_16557 [Crocosphaera chwakensis CCY0110]
MDSEYVCFAHGGRYHAIPGLFTSSDVSIQRVNSQ